MNKFVELNMAGDKMRVWVEREKIIGVQKAFFPAKSALDITESELPREEFWAVNFVFAYNALHQITQPAEIYNTDEEADEYIASIMGEDFLQEKPE